MGRLIEGLWDCKYCDTKGIGGSKRECPNCGRARDEDTVFYMPNKKVYIDEEKARKINKNPDWLCVYCDSYNSDSDTICASCGSPRTSENQSYFERRREVEEKEENENFSRHQETSFDEVKGNSDFYDDGASYEEEKPESFNISNASSKSNFESERKPSKKNFFRWISNKFSNLNFKTLIAILLAIAFVIGIIYLLVPKIEYVTVDGFFWERNINVQKNTLVKESDWTLPAEAKLLYTNEEIRSYENVLDHYEQKTRQVAKTRIAGYEDYVSGHRDLGNGYFEEIISQRPIYETYYEDEIYQEPVYKSVPVYDTKYYYEIYRWLHSYTKTSSGNDQKPYWHEVMLNSDERICSRVENYYIFCTDEKDNDKKLELVFDEWKSLSKGDTVRLKVSIFGNAEIVYE